MPAFLFLRLKEEVAHLSTWTPLPEFTGEAADAPRRRNFHRRKNRQMDETARNGLQPRIHQRLLPGQTTPRMERLQRKTVPKKNESMWAEFIITSTKPKLLN